MTNYPAPLGQPMGNQPMQHAIVVPQAVFKFDGGAATWFGTQILAVLITIFTLGIMYPFAVVLVYRWQCKHTYLNGYRMRFTGSAMGLLGRWILWLFLIIITFGIYSFWVYPRMTRWIVENQTYDSWPA